MLVRGYNLLCELPFGMPVTPDECKNLKGNFTLRVDVVCPDLRLLLELYDRLRIDFESNGFNIQKEIKLTTKIRYGIKSNPGTIPIHYLGITKLYMKKYRRNEKEMITKVYKDIYDCSKHLSKFVFRLKVYLGPGTTLEFNNLEVQAMQIISKWLEENNIVLVEASRRVTQLKGYLLNNGINNYWIWERCLIK